MITSKSANGRISSFRAYAGTFDPTLSMRLDYSDYGSPSAITVPGSSVPAPMVVYGAFND